MSQDDQTINFVSSTDEIIAAQNLQATTSIIDFHSAGHCLIVGDDSTAADDALAMAEQLAPLKCTVVIVKPDLSAIDKRLTESGLAVFEVPQLDVDGYLGAFNAHAVEESGTTSLAVSVYLESGTFDVVLDLSQTPLLSATLPPLGYYRGNDSASLEASLEAMPDLVGDFEKPKYFDYNASVCAHSRSELNGCNACVSVCATGAIQSAGEGISVDPYLCQGCGSCATVCPSGAMTYAYPKPANAIERSREMLRDTNCRVLLLYTEDQQAIAEPFEQHELVLPLLVEEVSAFGIDYWSSMLCVGVHHILLLVNDSMIDLSRSALESQIGVMSELLEGIGINDDVVQCVNTTELAGLNFNALQKTVLNDLKPSSFTTHNDKRQTIRNAFDVLVEQLAPEAAPKSMQVPAPFGRVTVNTEKCTLCMACVSVCPGKALLDGQDTPALRMVEANCVQCGMCAEACPESAIELVPQYVYDSIEARKISTLNEEAPFNCIRCQKPFATARIIQSMFEKLDGHWMFKDEVAKRRLKMCEDCRVKDIFERDSKGIDVHPPEEKA